MKKIKKKIVTEVYSVKVPNIEDEKIETKTVRIIANERNISKAIDEAAGCKVLSFTKIADEKNVYEMSVADFISHAKLVPEKTEYEEFLD